MLRRLLNRRRPSMHPLESFQQLLAVHLPNVLRDRDAHHPNQVRDQQNQTVLDLRPIIPGLRLLKVSNELCQGFHRLTSQLFSSNGSRHTVCDRWPLTQPKLANEHICMRLHKHSNRNFHSRKQASTVCCVHDVLQFYNLQ